MNSITQMFLNDVMGEIQNAEEMGGPEGPEYLLLMEAISTECLRRRDVYKARLASEPALIAKFYTPIPSDCGSCHGKPDQDVLNCLDCGGTGEHQS